MQRIIGKAKKKNKKERMVDRNIELTLLPIFPKPYLLRYLPLNKVVEKEEKSSSDELTSS